MKNLFKILFLSIFIFSCNDKYEIIDKETRFNVSNGEIEILLDNGDWVKKSRILKDIDRKKKEKERKEYEKQQRQLQIFPYSERQLVTGLSGFRTPTYSYDPVFGGTIKNDSNWKIEEIDFSIRVYSKSDSTKLRENICTVKFHSDFDGVNHTETEFSINKSNNCGLVKMDYDKEYQGWSMDEVRGYNPLEFDPND